MNENSGSEYILVRNSLKTRGAEAVMPGCTEIALPVQQEQTSVTLYDTTSIHAAKAVELATLE